MTQSFTNERRPKAGSLVRASVQKLRLMRRRLREIMISAFLSIAAVPWIVIAPAHAVDASGTATIRCGAFSGDPRSDPAWVQSVPYSIAGDRISLATAVRGETNQWNGTLDDSGHILLTGAGSGGGGSWVMHFSGKWRGVGETRLAGGYHNVSGMVGRRSCSISL